MRSKKDAKKPNIRELDKTDHEAIRRRRASANRTFTVLKAALNRAWREGKISNQENGVLLRTNWYTTPATKFLDRVTDGNGERQGFLQRYIGYSCTIFTNEHIFVFAYGTGAPPIA